MTQQDRRRNPYPWTWEPAAAITTVLVLAVLLGLQVGRTVANGLATGQWHVAAPRLWVLSAAAVAAGDAAAGLHPALTRSPRPPPSGRSVRSSRWWC